MHPHVFFPVLSPQECGTPGVELLSCALKDQRVSFIDQLDLVFKWISLRLCEKENVKAMGQVLLCLLLCVQRVHTYLYQQQRIPCHLTLDRQPFTGLACT